MKTDTLNDLLLANRCEQPLPEAEYQANVARYGAAACRSVSHPAWMKLYYGEQPAKAKLHLAKLAKDFPAEAALFAPHVDESLAQLAKANEARQQRKAEKLARQAARAEKAAKRQQLGVDLKAKGGVAATEATYRALRVGLLERQGVLQEWLTNQLRTDLARLSKRLEARGWHAGQAFPYKMRNGQLDTNVVESPHPLFWRLFRSITGSSRVVEVSPDAESVIVSAARQQADDAFAGFCAKLAGKVDSEIAAESNGVVKANVKSVVCASTDIWNNSILTVYLDDGRKQTWHTKVIWNVSCLGKSFNQWPTRRV
jgi:hypothetical protein